MYNQPCQNIQQTLDHIGTHINQSLMMNQIGARVATVSKMETPQGAYTFRISGVTRAETAVELIKRAIGDNYIYKSVDRSYGTLDVIILAEAFDRDTFAQADSLFKSFQTHQRALMTDDSDDDDDDDDESNEYESSHKKKSNASSKRKNKFALDLDQSKIFFLCLILLVLGFYAVSYVPNWFGFSITTSTKVVS